MKNTKLPNWCDEFPKNAIDYIESVINLLENKIGSENIVSVILFGSLASSKKLTEVSDVDLIIVLEDSISSKTFSNLNQLLTKKEEKFGFRKKPTSGIEQFLYLLESQTGMFISHFICRKSDFLACNFSRIFNVNPIVSSILAPKNIVFGNVVQSGKTLYGRNLLSEVKKVNISKIDLLRSYFMNTLLSTGALIIFKFYKRATKFSMEASKWSMFASYYYANRKTQEISRVIQYFEEKRILKRYLKKLMELRENYRNDFKFSFYTPFVVLKIHLSVLG